MRAVIQRVTQAKVKISDETIGEIGHGLLILLGIEEPDSPEDVEWLAKKICNLRIFNDQDGVMNLSILEKGFGILLISQFTLHASTKKGNRPSYIRSAKPDKAEPFYERMIEKLDQYTGMKTATGKFGANMQIHLVNDGPVTILMDSRNRE